LLRSEVAGRAMATTKEMLALESRLIDIARQGRGRCRPLGDPARPVSRTHFTEGQKAAVAHALGSRDRVMIIRGGAGTGKTSLEEELREALAPYSAPLSQGLGPAGAQAGWIIRVGWSGRFRFLFFLSNVRP
jgi:hypothetical protein